MVTVKRFYKSVGFFKSRRFFVSKNNFLPGAGIMPDNLQKINLKSDGFTFI